MERRQLETGDGGFSGTGHLCQELSGRGVRVAGVAEGTLPRHVLAGPRQLPIALLIIVANRATNPNGGQLLIFQSS